MKQILLWKGRKLIESPSKLLTLLEAGVGQYLECGLRFKLRPQNRAMEPNNVVFSDFAGSPVGGKFLDMQL